MKILLLSAYDAQSHQYWRKGLVTQCNQHKWHVLSLPARFFSWRVRGNSLTWAYTERKLLSQSYDLIIATSMTDLSALKGLVPNLANIPSIVYFHENQFEYPKSGLEFSSVEPQITSIYTALSATRIVFNSEFNRSTFLTGIDALMKKLPDHVPKGIAGILNSKSTVIPVPLNSVLPRKHRSSEKSKRLQVLWNHRWEFDKGPELLYKSLILLKRKSDDFTIHIVGQRFSQVPDVFERIKAEFSENIGYWGYVEDVNEYHELLYSVDIVLSTADHDFQGLSILQAVQHGAIPLVPNRLAYPEHFDCQFLYGTRLSKYNDQYEEIDAISIAKRLYRYSLDKQESGVSWHAIQQKAKQKLPNLLWENLIHEYRTLFADVV
ncbi:tRNA-queuosine alpha-mannosyltransferase domain-containing protein [Thalassotalea atypica]|uniref:tRNA-queuosine alpha-mannosyltransferase domain-containing protein n=1 Tax=Thalassotalea atypica TaxID=2054316 RepID=UPI00257238D6|nr:DUF3524 domain-containing protein [Thalassotalea atypica]